MCLAWQAAGCLGTGSFGMGCFGPMSSGGAPGCAGGRRLAPLSCGGAAQGVALLRSGQAWKEEDGRDAGCGDRSSSSEPQHQDSLWGWLPTGHGAAPAG